MVKSLLERVLFPLALLLLSHGAMAQSVATGTISGTVRDASGAVLPGVTVEAASPALIEKVRSAVTDGQGVYRVIDLRPGTYSVTFTLAGFNTLRRENVELTTGFTATVNGDLAVGNLAETVTVSGAAPIVDTQNVSQQTVFARQVTENLPVGSTVNLYATLIPGATLSSGAASQDVGGGKGEFSQGFTIHGNRGGDFQQLREGMFFGTLVAAGNRMTSLNPATVAEVTVQTSSGTAELESGGALISRVQGRHSTDARTARSVLRHGPVEKLSELHVQRPDANDGHLLCRADWRQWPPADAWPFRAGSMDDQPGDAESRAALRLSQRPRAGH
jgi:hypothetical protein